MKHRTEDFMLLWESETSVVIGKHQNAMAEINYRYLNEKHIPVARRLSGGGTVYHGPGNLNFTFIRNGEMGKLVNFEKFVSPVVAFLRTLGVQAELGQRNDILVNSLKISGNAEHVYKRRVLHHGTLLFNANLEILNESIKVIAGRFIDKAVQSNRSTVANIVDFLDRPLTLKEFKNDLFDYLLKHLSPTQRFAFSDVELQQINKLKEEKYSTEEWIFGYSPNFSLKDSFNFDGETNSFHFVVEKGNVSTAKLNFPGCQHAGEIEKALTGKAFKYQSFESALLIQNAISNEFRRKFLQAVFK